jgi:hypothetical protein
MRKFTFQVLTALAWLYPGLANAADCSLKIVNTIPLVMEDQNRRPYVPVIINGTKETFLLDTGGAITQISQSAAHELALPIGDGNIKMLDLYGGAAIGTAHIKTLGLGRLQDTNASLPIMTSTFAGQPYVGLLAPDYMGNYDIELDFAAGKMNYFSQDHCPGKVVYWPASAIAIVPMHFKNFHLTLPVMLDGKPIRAMIDTGAPNTTLNASAAKQAFDITADSPGARELEDDGGKKTFEYVFKGLSFEGMAVSNPHIVVLPDRMGSKDPDNNYVTGTRLQHVDDPDSSDPVMLIGMNILSKLHLYIAFGEDKIYITPAAAPAPDPQPHAGPAQ